MGKYDTLGQARCTAGVVHVEAIIYAKSFLQSNGFTLGFEALEGEWAFIEGEGPEAF